MNTRIYRLFPQGFSNEKFDFNCERDRNNAPFEIMGSTEEMNWEDFEIAAHSDEQVVFQILDAKGRQVHAVSFASLPNPSGAWNRAKDMSVSPPFVNPHPQNGSEVVIEINIVAVTCGPTPRKATNGTFTAPPELVGKRKIKIIFVPHIGD